MPTYHRGRKRPDNLHELKALSHARHQSLPHLLREIARAAPPAYDSRTLGFVPPVKDQSQCGSCWDFSGTFVAEVALMKAGKLRADGSDALSEEYTLDCYSNGGCNGDDNTTVLAHAKSVGLPRTAEYGPYTMGGRCKSGVTLYKIDDWGFVDGQSYDRPSGTDLIKAAIMTYGCVGCAVAAGSSWDSWSSDPNYVHAGGSTGIDHDVALVGWDDAKGAWIMRNSWGDWANGGYGWIRYGADMIGTEAVWATVAGAPVPPGPTPPLPPVPPTPSPGYPMDLTLDGFVSGPLGKMPVRLTGQAVPRTHFAGAPNWLALLADVGTLLSDYRGNAGTQQVLADALKLLADLGINLGKPPCGCK